MTYQRNMRESWRDIEQRDCMASVRFIALAIGTVTVLGWLVYRALVWL